MDISGVDSEEALKEVVRSLTLYEDTPDELTDSDLDNQITAAKIKLSTKVDSSDWYDDDGLTAALIGTTCIYAKCAVENYSITRWDIGDQYLDVSGVRDTDVPQFNEWAELVDDGLKKAESHSNMTPSFTKTYIGE